MGFRICAWGTGQELESAGPHVQVRVGHTPVEWGLRAGDLGFRF